MGEKKYIKALVIINETHALLYEQKHAIKQEYGDAWDTLLVPKNGWTKHQITNIADEWPGCVDPVFVSPVPLLLVLLTRGEIEVCPDDCGDVMVIRKYNVRVFHNDKRAQGDRLALGWELV